MEDFCGIVFRDGPTGHRAALVSGPDIWELMLTLKSGKAHGEEAITATAELLNLTDSQVRTAVRYYNSFPDEIDRRIALNTEDGDEAKSSLEAANRPPWCETPPRRADQRQGCERFRDRDHNVTSARDGELQDLSELHPFRG